MKEKVITLKWIFSLKTNYYAVRLTLDSFFLYVIGQKENPPNSIKPFEGKGNETNLCHSIIYPL